MSLNERIKRTIAKDERYQQEVANHLASVIEMHANAFYVQTGKAANVALVPDRIMSVLRRGVTKPPKGVAHEERIETKAGLFVLVDAGHVEEVAVERWEGMK